MNGAGGARVAFVVVRLLVATLTAAALVAQLVSTLASAGPGQHADLALNFVSYFTVDSNLASTVTLVVGAVALARHGRDSRGLTLVRLAVTTYLVLTGVVYNAILRGVPVSAAVVPWSNEVLHVVSPAYVALDWFVAPGRRHLAVRDGLVVLVFPAVWTVYSLVRAPFATDPVSGRRPWYPYPFLDPASSTGGYLTVAAYLVGVGVLFALVALGLTRSTPRATAEPRPRDG